MSITEKYISLVIVSFIVVASFLINIRLRYLRTQYLRADETNGRKLQKAIKTYTMLGAVLMLVLVVLTVFLLIKAFR